MVYAYIWGEKIIICIGIHAILDVFSNAFVIYGNFMVISGSIPTQNIKNDNYFSDLWFIYEHIFQRGYEFA